MSSGEKVVLPHGGVYVRLGRSNIHGVGIFAIRAIPKGTNIFGDDNKKPFMVDKESIVDLDEETKRLYEDFCAVEDGKYCCPESFNDLTVAWYINESKEPNTISNGYEFYASRDIRKGEELTVDYSSFSEEEEMRY